MVHGGWRGDSCTRAQGSPHFIESAHTGQRTRAPTKRMSQELCTRDLGGNWWWSHRPTFCRQAPPSNLAKRITVHRIAPPLLVLSREKGQMVHRPQSAQSAPSSSLGGRNETRCPSRDLREDALCNYRNWQCRIPAAQPPILPPRSSFLVHHCRVVVGWWHHIPFAQRFFVHSQFS